MEASNATKTIRDSLTLPEPIKLEMKKSLSELLISCWAKMAAGGIVGAVHFGAKGGGPV